MLSAAKCSPEVLAEIEKHASQLVGENKLGRNLMIRIRATKIISERCKIPSFAQWRSAFANGQ